jgi:hydroxyethylthiazole kinase-like uncharacterized protein yjeF
MNNATPILTASDMKDWDSYTMNAQSITSLQLMEQAAQAVTNWIILQYSTQHHFCIFCGTGNNGGDGFAIARQLRYQGFQVSVYLIGNTDALTEDAKVNYERLSGIQPIEKSSDFPHFADNTIIVDAILGIGSNRPLAGIYLELVTYLNQSSFPVVSVDIPSGWYADLHQFADNAVRAHHTLTFGTYKQSFLFPESEKFTGDITVLDIGLSTDFKPDTVTNYFWSDTSLIQTILQPIRQFSHKGTHGHAGLIAGSEGMMGAAVLACRASMRTGAGKTTGIIPSSQFSVIHQTTPEVLVKDVLTFSEENEFQAMGIGSGLGINDRSLSLLKKALNSHKPLVIDADAIHLITSLNDVHFHTDTILTPHVKEAKKLTGDAYNSLHLLAQCLDYCKTNKVTLVLKGKFTRVIDKEGNVFFNTTGNPGMASAGMGDVLTGIITSLAAQGYNGLDAALIGVYWHGYAADIAAESLGYPSLIASDVIEQLGAAYLKMKIS